MMRWFFAPWRFALFHLRRVFAWDLAARPVSDWEAARLDARGVQGEPTRRYLAWRRSNLLFAAAATLPVAVTHVLTSLDFYLENTAIWSRLGLAIQTTRQLALFALPLSAFAAFLLWSRPRLSRRVVVAGWVVSFLVPVLLSFVPPRLLFNLDGFGPLQQAVLSSLSDAVDVPLDAEAGLPSLRRVVEKAIDIFGGLFYAVLLLPSALSLVPGAFRACARLKVFLPGSSLPGWAMVTVAPICSFGFLVALVVVNQIVGDWRVLVSGLLFAAAPLVYLLRAPLFLRPASREEAERPLRLARQLNAAMVLTAAGFLLAYLWNWQWTIDDEVVLRGIGLSGDDSLVAPVAALHFVEYLGRSFFMTTLVADLVLRLHGLIWESSGRFADSAGRAEHDDAMRGLQAQLGRSR